MNLGPFALIVATLLCSPALIAASHDSTPAAKASAAAKGPLGDLSSFKTIAADTLSITKKGDLKAAKERIRDLESAWDEAEDKMRPMDEDAWDKADKAIDRALAKLRAPTPKKDECIEKLETLLSTFDSLQAAK
jgi:hypothetical protein